MERLFKIYYYWKNVTDVTSYVLVQYFCLATEILPTKKTFLGEN